MPLFFVNCERTVLFSVKRDLAPPFTTLMQVFGASRQMHVFSQSLDWFIGLPESFVIGRGVKVAGASYSKWLKLDKL